MHIKTIDEQAGIYEVHLNPVEEQYLRGCFPGDNIPVRIGNALRSKPSASSDGEIILDPNMILTYE
jgi:hypothetical protein